MKKENSVSIFKCFIASPSDTQEEREICDQVFQEINKTLGEHLSFRIESKKWENDARPSFGDDGQAVINKQLLSEYDLFIGIMWNRFGAPTPRAGSGTEEEFNQAYKRFKDGEDLDLLIYFNTEPVSPDELDPSQFNKVREFRDKVSELGGLYAKYNGKEDFRRKLQKDISDYFIKLIGLESSDDAIREKSEELEKTALKESISLIFRSRLNESLTLFSNQPIIWVSPILSQTNEISQNADDNYKQRIEPQYLIENPSSRIIKAPPQFGLTCLSHHLCELAWNLDKLWVYLDSAKTDRNSLRKAVNRELKNLNIPDAKPDCIILDSWVSSNQGAKKLLKNLCNEFPDTPICVMQTIDDLSFKENEDHEKIDRDFETLHLLALPRNEIRKVVSAYNSEKMIGDEDKIVNKLTQDLGVLNIHRTPINCLTLLKVSEKHFDESPVNRTRMLEMVLFVLFDLGELPTYKSRPDLKDCEYVLGRFCEDLIRNQSLEFSREEFIYNLDEFCKEKLIHLDISVVFDILYMNNIITRRHIEFAFRATYWVYYFAAKRMHASPEFCDFIFDNEIYVSSPEIVEFYSGIDRSRANALKILQNDLSATRKIVDSKIGLPEKFNPFDLIEWKPSQESIERLQEELEGNVLSSKLPESIKDQYADKSYDQLKPYDQRIQKFLDDSSLAILIQKIRASSRALRNSDYVDPDTKRGLLTEIIDCWHLVSKILFVLTPILATDGYAAFAGQRFILAGNFGKSKEDRIQTLMLQNPINVVRIFKDDIYSNKIGPLIYDHLKNESDKLKTHSLMLLTAIERPEDWRKHIESYINSLHKNSFYLFDVFNLLRTCYRFDFASDKELNEISYLTKMGIAKHEFGNRKTQIKDIKKISNSVLPKREQQ